MYDDQISENELRYTAKRRGLTMRKLYKQDRYMLVDPVLQMCVLGHTPEPFSATLRDIEEFLETYGVVEDDA